MLTNEIPSDADTLAAIRTIRAACEARNIGTYGHTAAAFRSVLAELLDAITYEDSRD